LYCVSVQDLHVSYLIHTGGISVSCVCYGFLYFSQLLSLIAVIFIFYLLVIFPSQTRMRVNIKVVRCLEYRGSLFPTQSVRRRNSDDSLNLNKNKQKRTECFYSMNAYKGCHGRLLGQSKKGLGTGAGSRTFHASVTQCFGDSNLISLCT